MPTRMADVPLHDRPRERLMTRGADALSECELLALVLRHGTRGQSALELAGALLAEYGSLQALATARPEELARRPGVGDAKAAVVVAAFRLGRLAGAERSHVVQLRGPEDIAQLAQGELAGLRRERVLVLVCDAANRLRRAELISMGSIDRSSLPVREILNCVLRHDGRSFAVAHNHPSGDPTPSDSDVRATRDIAAGAKIVGLRFLDHVVLGGACWEVVSLAS